MVLLTVSDFHLGSRPAVWTTNPAEAAAALDAAGEDRLLLADWSSMDALPVLLSLAKLGPRLLVPELWREDLPRAGLLISSAISGGWLEQRFLALSGRRCWLTLEPLRHTFPLPCPDGQGTPFETLPEGPVFLSDALCCRYLHQPDRVFLFDNAETMAKKCRLAEASGFQGYWEPRTEPKI